MFFKRFEEIFSQEQCYLRWSSSQWLLLKNAFCSTTGNWFFFRNLGFTSSRSTQPFYNSSRHSDVFSGGMTCDKGIEEEENLQPTRNVLEEQRNEDRDERQKDRKLFLDL